MVLSMGIKRKTLFCPECTSSLVREIITKNYTIVSFEDYLLRLMKQAFWEHREKKNNHTSTLKDGGNREELL